MIRHGNCKLEAPASGNVSLQMESDVLPMRFSLSQENSSNVFTGLRQWLRGNDIHRQRPRQIGIKHHISQQTGRRRARIFENMSGIEVIAREQFFVADIIAEFAKVAIDERHARAGIMGVIQHRDKITGRGEIFEDGIIAFRADAPEPRDFFEIDDRAAAGSLAAAGASSSSEMRVIAGDEAGPGFGFSAGQISGKKENEQ